MPHLRNFILSVPIALALAGAAYSAPLGMVDQQNRPADGRFFAGQNNMGQSFVPTLPAIDAIEFDLGSLSGGISTTYINLRDGVVGADGLQGPILGTTNSITLFDDSPILTRHFDFPSRIALIPGQTYVAELVGTNGAAGGLTFDDKYPQGEGLKAFSPGWDMVFAEGLHVPEPTTALLAAAGLAGLVAFARQRVRRG
jgi:hypothetical protein